MLARTASNCGLQVVSIRGVVVCGANNGTVVTLG